MGIKTVDVKINGLYPGDETPANNNDNSGSIVLVFLGKNPNMIKLLLEKADENGVVKGKISIEYIGKEVKLRIRKAGFKPIQTKIMVKSYGLFFTPKLVLDGVYTSRDGTTLTWDEEQTYTNSKSILDDEIRNFRHKNTGAKVLYYTFVILLIIIGAIVNPLIGALIGIIGFIFGEFFTPYTLGLKRLF